MILLLNHGLRLLLPQIRDCTIQLPSCWKLAMSLLQDLNLTIMMISGRIKTQDVLTTLHLSTPILKLEQDALTLLITTLKDLLLLTCKLEVVQFFKKRLPLPITED